MYAHVDESTVGLGSAARDTAPVSVLVEAISSSAVKNNPCVPLVGL